MQHDRQAVTFDRDGEICKLPVRSRRQMGEQEADAGKEQLPQPSRVRQVRADLPAVDETLDDEPVGTGKEGRGDDVLEEPHKGIVPDGSAFVTGGEREGGGGACWRS